jgi:DNA-binding response OmpR family regulator
MFTNKKILLVEDNLSLGFLLTEFLEREGIEVKHCRDGVSGLAAFKRDAYDLCILDVMMPKMDGFNLAVKIREVDPHIPFLFLTARSLKDDKLKGYSLGAEDYLTKPFDEEELLCRIRVIFRRKETIRESEKAIPDSYTIGDYIFNYSRQELVWNDETWRMTEKENEILRLLCLNQNNILRRDEAVEKIYGKRDYFLGRSFDVFISKLRKLLQNDERITIENVFRVGFILNVKGRSER